MNPYSFTTTTLPATVTLVVLPISTGSSAVSGAVAATNGGNPVVDSNTANNAASVALPSPVGVYLCHLSSSGILSDSVAILCEVLPYPLYVLHNCTRLTTPTHASFAAVLARVHLGHRHPVSTAGVIGPSVDPKPECGTHRYLPQLTADTATRLLWRHSGVASFQVQSIKDSIRE